MVSPALEGTWSCGSACYHLFLPVPERSDCGFEWMARSGLNGEQPWDLELLCGRERRKEGGRRDGERKKVRKGERVEERQSRREKGGRGRAGVSGKQGVRDRWMKKGGREGGGSGTTDVLSLGPRSAFSPAIVEFKMVDDSVQQKESCQRNARRTLARITPLSPGWLLKANVRFISGSPNGFQSLIRF